MITRVLRKMGYAGTFIYILQYNYTFQYLFSLNNEIYRQEIQVIPRLWKRILWRLGLLQTLYTREQLEQGEQIVLSGAMVSIDKIKEKGARKKRKEAEFKAKKAQSDCMWQIRQTEKGEGLYCCVNHDVCVPIEEGKAPSHLLK